MTYLEGSMPSQDDRDYEESIYSMNPPINPTNSFFSMSIPSSQSLIPSKSLKLPIYITSIFFSL